MPMPTKVSAKPITPTITKIQKVRMADVMCEANGVPASSWRLT